MNRLLIYLPATASAILAIVLVISGSKTNPANFDLVKFLFFDKIDTTIAIALTFVQLAASLMADRRNRKIAGRWEVNFQPTNWKGSLQEAKKIHGRGTLILGPMLHSENIFRGYQ